MKSKGIIFIFLIVIIAAIFYIGPKNVINFITSQTNVNPKELTTKPKKVETGARAKEKKKEKPLTELDANYGMFCATGHLLNNPSGVFSTDQSGRKFLFNLRPNSSSRRFSFNVGGTIEVFFDHKPLYLNSQKMIKLTTSPSSFRFTWPGSASIVAGNKTTKGALDVYKGPKPAKFFFEKEDRFYGDIISRDKCYQTVITLEPSSLKKIENLKLKKNEYLFIISDDIERKMERGEFSVLGEKRKKFLLYNWNSSKGQLEKIQITEGFPIVWKVTSSGDIFLGGLDQRLTLKLTPLRQI
jgi:hypothetical protein